jgi:hypothetical protein
MRLLPLLTTSLLAATASAQLSCSSVSCGNSCGPTLTVTFAPILGNNNMRLEMLACGLHPHSIMALAWGDSTTHLTLPGGCPLLINQIWSELHMTDATGSFSWGRTWPHWAVGQFYMQMGSAAMLPNGLSILTTDCQLAGCL